MRTLKKQLTVSLIIIISIIASDQITKFLAVKYLKPGEHEIAQTINVVGDLFILQYAENRGAFLSMGKALPEALWVILFAVIPAIFLIGLFVYIVKHREQTMTELIIFSGIVAGGLGNLYDRILYGYVVDFMNFGIGNLRTGILNIADIPITMGIIYLLIYYFIKDVQKKIKKETVES